MVNLRLSFFEVFQLKLPYNKSSESVISENNHILLETIVLICIPKYNFKFKVQVLKKISKQKCMR